MQVLGVDGHPRGWVGVVLDGGRFSEAALARTLAELLGHFPEAAVVGVDIPIGLPERQRRADQAARDFVGLRRVSVFPTPPKRVLEQPSHAEAVRECRRLGLGGISRQAYALRGKILEADPWPRGDERMVEVHPEVSFREMARESLPWAKTTWNGLMLRRSLLARVGIHVPDRIDDDRTPAVDLLDAAAAAWSAHRYALGRGIPLPADTTARIGAIWR